MFTPPQIATLDAIKDHAVVGYVGGYGAGKSYVGAHYAVLAAICNPNCDVAVCEPTRDMLHGVMLPALETAAKNFGVSYEVTKQPFCMKIFYAGNCSRIHGLSYGIAESIAGFNFVTVVADELDRVPYSEGMRAYENLSARLRQKAIDPSFANNPMLITTTPEGFNVSYDILVKNPSENPELAAMTKMINAKTRDNPYLPEQYVRRQEALYSGKIGEKAYLLGEFENLEGSLAAYAYKPIQLASNENDTYPWVRIGIDFNTDKTAAVAWYDGEIVKEWHNIQSTFDMVEEVRVWAEMHGNPEILWYPDAAGAFRAASSWQTSHDILSSIGEVIAPKRNPPVRLRWETLNKVLNDDGIKIDKKRTPFLHDALNRVVKDKYGNPKDSTDEYIHICDALGYLAVGI